MENRPWQKDADAIKEAISSFKVPLFLSAESWLPTPKTALKISHDKRIANKPLR